MNSLRLTALPHARVQAGAWPAEQPVELRCADGRRLSADWFEPAEVRPSAVAVISSAAGVPRGFYRGFARWLADRGYSTLIYDYRGVGQSVADGDPRRDRASMADWALLDMSAAIAAGRARQSTIAAQTQTRENPGHARSSIPLLPIGHSFGGHAIGFATGVENADALLAVGSQAGEWRVWPPASRLPVAGFFGVWLPTLVRLFGYLPGWALGPAAQPLPAGVATDWSRWGLRRGAQFDDPAIRPHSRYSRIVAPVHLWSIDDDWAFAPVSAVDALSAKFPAAKLTRHHLRPAEVGLSSLGHFGAFRRRAGETTWTRLLESVEASLAQANSGVHGPVTGNASSSPGQGGRVTATADSAVPAAARN